MNVVGGEWKTRWRVSAAVINKYGCVYITSRKSTRGLRCQWTKACHMSQHGSVRLREGWCWLKRSYSTVLFVMVLVTCRFMGQRGAMVMRARMSDISIHLTYSSLCTVCKAASKCQKFSQRFGTFTYCRYGLEMHSVLNLSMVWGFVSVKPTNALKWWIWAFIFHVLCLRVSVVYSDHH